MSTTGTLRPPNIREPKPWNVVVDADLHRKIKAAAALKRLTLQEVIDQALKLWLQAYASDVT